MGSRSEQRYHGSAVEGFWADSYESAHEVLSSYEDELYIEHLEDRVLAEWEIPSRGFPSNMNIGRTALDAGGENKISFPNGWGTRRKVDKVEWLKRQDEVMGVPYLFQALKVWGFTPLWDEI